MEKRYRWQQPSATFYSVPSVIPLVQRCKTFYVQNKMFAVTMKCFLIYCFGLAPEPGCCRFLVLLPHLTNVHKFPGV